MLHPAVRALGVLTTIAVLSAAAPTPMPMPHVVYAQGTQGAQPDTNPAPVNPDTIPLDSLDNTPDDPTVDDVPQGAVNPEMRAFLQSAVGGLSASDVVKAACRDPAHLEQYLAGLARAGEVLGTFRGINGLFGGRGVGVADFAASTAAHIYAKAVSLGTQAEKYAATFAVGSLCNTSETARLASAQFTFLRDVVNKGIREALAPLDSALGAAANVRNPVAEAMRGARLASLYATFRPSAGVPNANTAFAALDASTRDAYATAARADSLSARVLTDVNGFYRELQGAPDGPGCATVEDASDATAPAFAGDATRIRCGPLSPGRAQQMNASLASLQQAQMSVLNTLSARRLDLEAVRAQQDVWADRVERSSLLISPVR